MAAKRLIVSFIGRRDLDNFPPKVDEESVARELCPVCPYIKKPPPKGDEQSPILRLLLALPGLTPAIPLKDTRLVLLDDDNAEKSTRRREFCVRLERALPEYGLSGLTLERRAVGLPGPTDLKALYEEAWPALRAVGVDRAGEVVFHLSSGTPAMQVTLLLAAHGLRLARMRLIETSREHPVREVLLPYVLATRDIDLDKPVRPLPLPDAARRALLPDTVIDDPIVASVYASLYKAAQRNKVSCRLLLRGPSGSGKWHAGRQLAQWRGAPVVEWVEPGLGLAPETGATLLIRHLDAWPAEALPGLRHWAEQRTDLAIAATWRTDRTPTAPRATRQDAGLPGAARLDLPALRMRGDVAALSEALARQLGLADGKLRERLHYDLLTDLYPRDLHELKSLLASADLLSPGKHAEAAAFRQVREIEETAALLEEAWWHLHNPGNNHDKRPSLVEVLDVIRAAVVRRVRAEGRNQTKTADLLGYSQTTISEIENKPLVLTGWRAAASDVDDDD